MKASDATKKNEYKTYQKLGLSREHKSRKNRRKAEEDKIWMYIGGGREDRPFLKVLKADYLRVWDEVNFQIAQEQCAQKFSFDQASDLRRRRVEQIVYDTLAAKNNLVMDLETSFQKKHGRGMTPYERGLYTKMMDDSSKKKEDAVKRSDTLRKTVIQRVLKQIEGCQRNQSSRLQEAWASVVGTEIAQETLLEKIDEQNGVAVCRCMNAALAFRLRRDKNLAEKLSKELDFLIKKVIFRS